MEQRNPTSYAELARLFAAHIHTQRLPLFAISGAQGSGKTTLAHLIAASLGSLGTTAAVVSLDDFYLDQASRQQLARQVDLRLSQRGVPGTHDIASALAVTRRHLRGQAVALPRFDKALDEPAAAKAQRHYDCLIIEGWCLGVLADSTQAHDRYQRYVEAALTAYQPWFCLLSPLLYLQAPDWPTVCRWRAAQEQQLWHERGAGMTPAQLEAFMTAFAPLTARAGAQLPRQADCVVRLGSEHEICQLEFNHLLVECR